ncbi:unnamed protein product [Closterium sp. Yama58-4]|nr:unnamed protein product [Closterium sp. Yama58-4]
MHRLHTHEAPSRHASSRSLRRCTSLRLVEPSLALVIEIVLLESSFSPFDHHLVCTSSCLPSCPELIFCGGAHTRAAAAMGVLAKLLYILVEDDDEGEEERAGSSKLAAEAGDTGGKGARAPPSSPRAAVRYTKSVLSSTLQLVGCKSRHAVKISERVFQILLQQVTSRRVFGHRTDVAHRSRMANGSDGIQRFARPNREDSGAVLATSASHVITVAASRLGMTTGVSTDSLQSAQGPLSPLTSRALTPANPLQASRLGITIVVSSDSLRHMMRGFSSREANPLLYASTYQAGEHLDPTAVADAKARKKASKLGGKHSGAQADTQAAAAQRDWQGGRERGLAAGEVGGQVGLREMQGGVCVGSGERGGEAGVGSHEGVRLGEGRVGGEGNRGGGAVTTGGGGGGREEREMGEAVWDGRTSVTGLERERNGEGGDEGRRDLESGRDAVNGKEPMSEKEVVSEREGVSEREMVIQGYKAQSEMVIGSVEQLLCKWERCHESAMVEGVHLSLNFVMEVLKRHPTIIPFVIYIGNEAKHMERFAVRAKYMTLDPRRNKYVRYMRNIRTIQDYLVRRADKHLIPKVNNTNMDKSVAAIHATVFACLRHRAAGESMYSRTSNTLPLLRHEYDAQYTASGLGSKGMLDVIQREGSLREGSVRSSASDPPDSLSGLPTRAVSLPTYAFGADSRAVGAGEPYPPAAAHTRLSPVPPDFPPDGSPHGFPPGAEASQSHGPPSLSTLPPQPPHSLRVSEGSAGSTSWGAPLQAGQAHACVHPEELSDGYASGYSSAVPPRGPRDRFASAAASFPAAAQGLPWQAGHGQVPPPPAAAIPLLNLSETPSATEGSLESPSALLSSGVSACSTPRVGAPGAGASVGASGGGGGSLLAHIHVRFSGRTAFPRSADVGSSSGGEGLAERERERRARGGGAAAAAGVVGGVGAMRWMGMGRLAKAMDGVRMSGGGQFAAHMPSFYGPPASRTHALQKKEEVCPLCLVVRLLCLVVRLLCLVVRPLCLVVRLLCLVVRLLCLVVRPLCLVVCSLCLVWLLLHLVFFPSSIRLSSLTSLL